MSQKLSVFAYSAIAFSLQIILIKVFEYLLLFTNVTEILPLGVLGISIGTIAAAYAKKKYSPRKLETSALAILAVALALIIPATIAVEHYMLVALSILSFTTLGFLVALSLIGRNFTGAYVFEILGCIVGMALVWALLPVLGAEILFLGCILLIALVALGKRAWAACVISAALLASISIAAAFGTQVNLIHLIRKPTNTLVPDGARYTLRSATDAHFSATRWSMLDRVDAITFDGRISLFFNDREWTSLNLLDPPVYPYQPGARSALIIGVGAGRDIRELKAAAVERVVGAEISPEVVKLMRGPLHQASGGIYDRAEVHTVDGRAFLRGSRENFDIITSHYPDLMKGGKASHTFAENYLWTQEGFEDLFRHLSPRGQFFFARSIREGQPAAAQRFRRFLATLSEGMKKARIPAEGHGLVFLKVPSQGYYKFYFVMKRAPFTREEILHLNSFHRNDIPVVEPLSAAPPPPPSLPEEAKQAYSDVQELFGGRTAHWSLDTNLSNPATDDRPFLEYVPEYALFSSFLMNCMLGLIFVIAVIFVVLGAKTGHAVHAPAIAQIHCFFSGMYFCLIETYLIRRLNFAFGNPVQNMALVLLTMLVGAAVPAAMAARPGHQRHLKWLIALSPLAALMFFAFEPAVTALNGEYFPFAELVLLALPIGIFSSFLFPNLCRVYPEGTGLLYGLNLLGFFFGSALALAIGLELGNRILFFTALAITSLQAVRFLWGRWEREVFSMT